MKNRYLLIPLALVLAGCVAPSPTPAASKAPLPQNGSTQPQAQVALQEIHLDTALPSAVGELVDWLFAFGATPDGGTGERVFSYGSADSLRADTLKQLATMPDLKNPAACGGYDGATCHAGGGFQPQRFGGGEFDGWWPAFW